MVKLSVNPKHLIQHLCACTYERGITVCLKFRNKRYERVALVKHEKCY